MAKAYPAGIVESREEGAGEAPGRSAAVKLQQLCFWQGDGGGVPRTVRCLPRPISIDDARLPLEYRA
jgi:hypothetical protein